MIGALYCNTLVVDYADPKFVQVTQGIAPGEVCMMSSTQLPDISEGLLRKVIEERRATPGGPGNSAPLIARAGLGAAIAGMVGEGPWHGAHRLDLTASYFAQRMIEEGVYLDLHAVPGTKTGMTFIHQAEGGDERAAIAYYPNANHAFHFSPMRVAVESSNPAVVAYLYIGLSEGGDARDGQDLADFLQYCRKERGAITMADIHTLAQGDAAYQSLERIVPQTDLFFVSRDEAKLVLQANGAMQEPGIGDSCRVCDTYLQMAMDWVRDGSAEDDHGMRMFGITLSDGAIIATRHGPASWDLTKVSSRYLFDGSVNLVGAGDSFRAGMIAYIAAHQDAWRDGTLNTAEAAQTGALFASLYVNAPLANRYAYIPGFKDALHVVRDGATFETLPDLLEGLELAHALETDVAQD